MVASVLVQGKCMYTSLGEKLEGWQEALDQDSSREGWRKYEAPREQTGEKA